jgi:hypothetical protein
VTLPGSWDPGRSGILHERDPDLSAKQVSESLCGEGFLPLRVDETAVSACLMALVVLICFRPTAFLAESWDLDSLMNTCYELRYDEGSAAVLRTSAMHLSRAEARLAFARGAPPLIY